MKPPWERERERDWQDVSNVSSALGNGIVISACDVWEWYNVVYKVRSLMTCVLVKESWMPDLKRKLEQFLSVTLKPSNTPRLLTLYVSFCTGFPHWSAVSILTKGFKSWNTVSIIVYCLVTSEWFPDSLYSQYTSTSFFGFFSKSAAQSSAKFKSCNPFNMDKCGENWL